MRGEHGHAPVPDAADDVPRRAAAEGIHAGRRLVQEADAWVADEGQAEGELALLAAGETAGARHGLLGQAHLLHHLPGPLAQPRGRDPPEPGVQHEVLEHGELRPEHVVLRADADDLADLAHASADGETRDLRVAGRGRQHAGEHVERRRLPGPIVPEQREDLALVHGQLEVRDGHLHPAGRGELPPQPPDADQDAGRRGAGAHGLRDGLHGVAPRAHRGHVARGRGWEVAADGAVHPVGGAEGEARRQADAVLLREDEVEVPPQRRPQQDVRGQHRDHDGEAGVVDGPPDPGPRRAELRRLELYVY